MEGKLNTKKKKNKNQKYKKKKTPKIITEKHVLKNKNIDELPKNLLKEKAKSEMNINNEDILLKSPKEALIKKEISSNIIPHLTISETINFKTNSISSSKLGNLSGTGVYNKFNELEEGKFKYHSKQVNPFLENVFYFNPKLNILEQRLPKCFSQRLHNDILQYCEAVDNRLSILKSFKFPVIKYVENEIKKVLGINMKNELHGSFATDLCIESSDIDLTIIILEDVNYAVENILNLISLSFEGLGVFESVNPIYTANVPLIKLV
jgi:hypothetical protein